MKKFAVICTFLCAGACLFGGCNREIDYLSYVSEKRTDIYLYSDDGLEIKIYVCERETPYSTDGIKGEMSDLTEIYVTLPKNYDEVNISAGNATGEMSYKAADNCYYLSLSDGGIYGDSVDVTLNYGGESEVYTLSSVLYGGVISCDEAIKCVLEYDGQLFASLTENNIFCGEIYVRLLYDDGCYYYVGVCDRNKKISAYLVDGEKGKIIAKKELNG